MLDTGTFSHAGAGGSTPQDRMDAAGFEFEGNWMSGENIGFQTERGAPGLADDVAQIHESLMDSPGHRANILNPGFEEIGIGIEFDAGDVNGPGSVMVTQNFAATDAADAPAPDTPTPEAPETPAPEAPEPEEPEIVTAPGEEPTDGATDFPVEVDWDDDTPVDEPGEDQSRDETLETTCDDDDVAAEFTAADFEVFIEDLVSQLHVLFGFDEADEGDGSDGGDLWDAGADDFDWYDADDAAEDPFADLPELAVNPSEAAADSSATDGEDPIYLTDIPVDWENAADTGCGFDGMFAA